MVRTATTATPEQMSGSDFLAKPGIYHLVITDIKDGESCKKERMIDGIGVALKVLAGPETGKTTNQDIMDGKDSHKDGGEFCNARMTAFLLAANLVTPEQLTGGEISYDEQQARGHQIVATFENSKDKEGNKTEYLEFKRFEIYHVDDPRAKDTPKCKDSLALIPAEFRRKPEFFASLTAKTSSPGSGNGNGKKEAEPDFGGL